MIEGRSVTIFNTITKERALKNLEKFMTLSRDDLKLLPKRSRLGVDIIKHYQKNNIIETKGIKGVSYKEFVENLEYYKRKPYYNWFLQNSTHPDPVKQLFDMRFGFISIFRPLTTVQILEPINPRIVLDFTMGWGGRLIGCCYLQIEKYIGIDSNTKLKKGYVALEREMKKYSKTDIQLHFKNALSIDYSKFNYDCVLTSPPYFNTELYYNTDKKTDQEWVEQFYKPITIETYKHLCSGGHYILIIRENMYKEIFKDILGNYTKRLPFLKSSRNVKVVDPEYIYMWRKN